MSREVRRPGSLEALQEMSSARPAAWATGFRSQADATRWAASSSRPARCISTPPALDAVLGSDPVRGLLRIEAGADWPRIIAATHAIAGPTAWGIRQKQTGVDAVTLGGSISANAHGRGLLMQPLADDIEDLTLVDAKGDVVTCSRSENPELFSLVIGGYGLFGVIHARHCASRRAIGSSASSTSSISTTR
jgi:FAD/FMN-containing dehydrogenase